MSMWGESIVAKINPKMVFSYYSRFCPILYVLGFRCRVSMNVEFGIRNAEKETDDRGE